MPWGERLPEGRKHRRESGSPRAEGMPSVLGPMSAAGQLGVVGPAPGTQVKGQRVGHAAIKLLLGWVPPSHLPFSASAA